jgi:acyl-CoA thioesterase
VVESNSATKLVDLPPAEDPRPMPDPSPQQIAERVRDAMLADDRATRMMGIRIREVAAGRSVAEMTVREDMLNGHDLCQGGFVTTLADTAFAYACNAYNELTVASGFSVDLMAPGRKGDLLTASCEELSKSGRTGVYDVTVRNQRGERIAVFRGRSYTARGKPVVDLG